MLKSAFLALGLIAKGASEYAAPDLSEWYATLKQPDNPIMSCCGWGDAYEADQQEFDEAGNLIAIITDTCPDVRELPDGRVISRPHLKRGTKILVPKSKIRKHPVENPTDHTIIFVGANGTVYCYEPATLI